MSIVEDKTLKEIKNILMDITWYMNYDNTDAMDEMRERIKKLGGEKTVVKNNKPIGLTGVNSESREAKAQLQVATDSTPPRYVQDFKKNLKEYHEQEEQSGEDVDSGCLVCGKRFKDYYCENCQDNIVHEFKNEWFKIKCNDKQLILLSRDEINELIDFLASVADEDISYQNALVYARIHYKKLEEKLREGKNNNE